MQAHAPADAFAGAYEERVIKTVDGLDLYARDYAPREPVTGLPVICLHGLTRNSADFEVVAPRIAALGRRVIAPDMRGRARSAYDPDPAHYVPAVYAQDVVRLLDELSVPRAVFVGTSLGGIISMAMAAMAPDRIAAAALNDVGPILEREGLAYIGGYVGHTPTFATWPEAAAAAKSRIGSAYPGREHDGAFWDTFARRTFRQTPEGVRLDYDPNIALAFSDPETAPAIDMTPLFEALASRPVLLLRGAISNLLSPAGAARMHEIKPDLVSVEVADVGHAPTLEEDVAWEALIDFLARVP